jgi:hypothetical protein
MAFLAATLILWVALFAVVLHSVNVGLTSTEPLGTRHVYESGYSAALKGLILLMAVLLIGVVMASGEPGRVSMRAFLPPAFLLATVLHIATWGVSASKWLVTQQPMLGSALWTFLLLGMPISVAIVVLYLVGIATARPGQAGVSRA